MNTEILRKIMMIKSEAVEKQLKSLGLEQKEKIMKAKTNEEIIEELELLKIYCFKVPQITFEITDYILTKGVEIAEQTSNVKGLGIISGKSHGDLLILVLDLLDNLRYQSSETVIRYSLPLTLHSDTSVKGKAIQVLKNIAKYNLNVIKRLGYEPQRELIDLLMKLKKEEKIIYSEAMIQILEELLGPEFEGTDMQDESTMSLVFGCLSVNDDLKYIRSTVIEILISIYKETHEDSLKGSILKLLAETSRTSNHVTSGDFESLVIENINKVVDFYISIASEGNPFFVLTIEKEIYWFKRRFGKRVPRLNELIKLIKGSKEYSIFKILLGSDLFDEDYDRLSWEEAEKRNASDIKRLIEEMEEGNIDLWRQRIDKLIDAINNRNESAVESQFRSFLTSVGQSKPRLAMKLIKTKLKTNDYLLAELLGGLLLSDEKEVKTKMRSWIEKNQHLIACTYAFDNAKKNDTKIYREIFKKGKGEQEVINALTYTIKRGFDANSSESSKMKKIYVDLIEEMTKLKNSNWTTNIFYKERCILDSFDIEDWKTVAKNLVYAPRLDYHVLEALRPMVKLYPELILQLFKDRLAFARKNAKIVINNTERYYDALPSDFENLREELRSIKRVIVPGLLSFYDDKTLSKYEIGSMLKGLFELEELDKYLISDKKAYLISDKTITSILFSFQGHIPITSKFVERYIIDYFEDDQRMQELMSVMSMSGGVVTGEYGFAESMEFKLKQCEEVQLKEEKIAAFVGKYKEFLKLCIAAERKSTDEEIVIRKQQFNS